MTHKKKKMIWLFAIAVLVVFVWKSFYLLDHKKNIILDESHGCDVKLFLAKIDNAKSQIVDLTAPDELFLNENFLEVYENPEAYYSCAIELLQDTELDVLHKTIIIFSMKKINVKYYLQIIQICYQEFLKKRIDENLLSTAILSPFGKSHPFVHSYNDNQAIALIDSMMVNDDLSSDFRGTLKKIKSGQLSKELFPFDKYH